jgi:hypothetical protein
VWRVKDELGTQTYGSGRGFFNGFGIGVPENLVLHIG